MNGAALSLEGISVAYGQHEVVRDVTLSVQPGETVALAGENGAGKSTLAKVIAGVLKPTRGQLRVRGRAVSLAGPWEALDNGIAFIPQELAYAPNLTVAENICLGMIPHRMGFTSQRAILEQAQKTAARLGFDLPLRAPMAEISLMQRQLVEILKAFGRNPQVLVLDEPTAALEAADSARLLQLVSSVAKSGVGVVYISHRLDEVFETCDTVHVLRSGNLVLSKPIKETTPSEVVRAMLNRSLDEVLVPKRTREGNRRRLEISRWIIDRSSASPPEVSFEIVEGEILGLYGIRGSGADSIAEALAGLRPNLMGDTRIDGRPVPRFRTPAMSRAFGVAYIPPPERKSQGLLLGHEVLANASLPALSEISTLGLIRHRFERRRAHGIIERMSVKCRSLNQPVLELSGGNQQKVLVGSRASNRGVSVLVAQEPTRGVDVGSRLDIHRQLRALAETGLAILLVTSDLVEAIILSDRLLIIRRGGVVAELVQPKPSDQEAAYNLAGGLTDG